MHVLVVVPYLTPPTRNDDVEAHRAATVLTLLVFLWGTLSVLVVPWRTFWIPNLSQAVGCTGLFVYLARTWKRPRRRVANAITAVLLGQALLVLPWSAIQWCHLGRPIEAFTVPQLAVIVTALVLSASWRLIIIVTSLFFVESLFPYAYAHLTGLGDMLPINEPLATLGITAVGAGLLILRRHRQQQAEQHVRLQAELNALERMRPVFSHTISELEEQLMKLNADIPRGDRASIYSRSVGRALERLGRLRGQLSSLAVPAERPAVTDEERYLDRDAQFGARVLTALTAAITAGTMLWTYVWLGPALAVVLLVKLAIDLTVLTGLLATRHRPSSRRAVVAILIVLFTAFPVVDIGQMNLLTFGRPYVALFSLKMLMCILGLTLTTRFRLGLVLILITAADALAVWFALDLGAHRDLIAFAEPYATLVFLMISLISLRMLEQRKHASLRLLRQQAAASAAQRSADMLFALHDRLNSPLQTLTLAATAVTRNLPVPSGERVQQAIDRLVELSRELGNVEIPAPHSYPLRDADDELRRHA